jgi:hypothetical protein
MIDYVRFREEITRSREGTLKGAFYVPLSNGLKYNKLNKQ